MNENNAVELLLVEDRPEDLKLTLHSLKKPTSRIASTLPTTVPRPLSLFLCEGPFAGPRITDAPKVFLLDLKLPKIGGLEVLKRIKDDPRTKTIPVVVLTSSKEKRDVVASYQVGVTAML
jgi:two-component system response regulator